MSRIRACPVCGVALLYLGGKHYTCVSPGCPVKLVSETALGKMKVKEAS